MKLLIITTLVILILSNVSALSSDLKQIYSPGETIIISFGGQILEPVKFENVEILRGHVKIPFVYDVKQIDETQFLWGISPEKENNYTLIIKGIATEVAGVKKKVDYMQNFSVEGNFTDYNVKPGFISTKNDVEIEIFSYLEREQKIPVSFPFQKDVILSPGENKINIPIGDTPKNRLITLSVGKYSIPLYVIGNESIINPERYEGILKLEPQGIYYLIKEGENVSVSSVYLFNSGDKDIKKVEILYNKSTFNVKPSSFNLVKAGQRIYFNISLKNQPSYDIKEIVGIKSDNESSQFLFEVKMKKKLTEEKNNSIVPRNNSNLYCPQLSGIVCKENDQCLGSIVSSKEGACCIGRCISINKSGKAWIGYLLMGILILFALLIWSRYKKSGKRNMLAEKISEVERKI